VKDDPNDKNSVSYARQQAAQLNAQLSAGVARAEQRQALADAQVAQIVTKWL